jgi:hypothetical protein
VPFLWERSPRSCIKQKKVKDMKKATTILAFFLALAASFGDGGKPDSSEEFRTLTGESAAVRNKTGI